jgi:hypothetical protein
VNAQLATEDGAHPQRRQCKSTVRVAKRAREVRGCATLSGNRSCGAETVAFSKKSEFYKKAHQEMK